MGSFRLARISIDVIFPQKDHIYTDCVSTQKVNIVSLWRHEQITKLVCVTIFLCFRLVGNILMRSNAILVYHH